MKDVFERIRSHAAEAYVGSGVGETAVVEAGAALGVSFPASYGKFLREVGVTLWPREIYGLVEGNDRFSNVVRMTLSERTEMEPPLLPTLVVLSPDGWGNHFCLDTSRPCGDECPVVFWNHELGPDQIPKQIAEGFIPWLTAEIDEEESRSD